MSGINKVILVGNVGSDVELKQSNSGQYVRLTLAVSQSWTDQASKEKREHVEWFTIMAFNKLAEIAGQYITKGAKLYVEGKIRTSKYTGDDGIEKTSFSVFADVIQILSQKNNADGKNNVASQNNNRPNVTNGNNGSYNNSSADSFSDDIPF